MSDEIVFVDGMIAKKPSERAPEFIISNVSFKTVDFIDWARKHQSDGWVRVVIKESKGGKHYASLDTFVPTKKEEYDTGLEAAREAAHAEIKEDDIPFANPYKGQEYLV